MEPALNSFKYEVEAMFEKTFQQLSKKNNLNKAILSNLMEAAVDQSKRIAQLDDNLENLKNTSVPQINNVKSQVNAQEKQIHDNFDHMMMRLNQIEEGISHSSAVAEKNLQLNHQSQQSMNELLKQLQKMERQQGTFQYSGSRDQLMRQVEEFEKILDEETEKMKNIDNSLEFSQKTTLEPIKTFQTKVAVHNRNNEDILKDKLRNFTDKLKKLQKRVDEAGWNMTNETNKAKHQQKKMMEEMGTVEREMGRLRAELNEADQKRKQQIQSSAATLDNMVEQMLVETKKLQLRVDSLRKGFEHETQKFKRK